MALPSAAAMAHAWRAAALMALRAAALMALLAALLAVEGCDAPLKTSVVQTPPAAPIWSALAAGANHSLGIKSDGTLWAWGANTHGQLGDGTSVNKSFPVQIGTGTSWSAVAAGANHSLALQTDGSLWAWGSNASGQVGDGSGADQPAPVHLK
ncbi:MAG TPA: hypothetical protein VL359_08615, partial [bacterium]|nr:hypothetical protein [bacterium]